MNKAPQLAALDSSPTIGEDTAWVGVNERLSPGQLPAGFASQAVNMRFEDGTATTRGGIMRMPWGDGMPVRSGGSVGLAFPGVGTASEFGQVVRAREYTDPRTGQEFIITVYRYSDNSLGVTRSSPNNRSRVVTVADGITTSGEVTLIQTFSGMVLLCQDIDPLYLDNWSHGFIPAPPGDGVYSRCPKGVAAVYWQNRLFVVSESEDPALRDAVWIGNVGTARDALYGDPVLRNYFAINAGSQDPLVGVFPLNETTLLCGKTRSVYAAANVAGDNATIQANVVIQEVTTEFGWASPRAVVQVGNDVWFLSQGRGIMSVTATAEGRNFGVSVPVSEPMQKTVNQINWARARQSVAATWGNKVYFAVPIELSDWRVMVFDTRQQAWSGYDVSDALDIVDWVQFRWNGELRLGFVHRLGPVMLYEEGHTDESLALESGVM